MRLLASQVSFDVLESQPKLQANTKALWLGIPIDDGKVKSIELSLISGFTVVMSKT